MPAGNYLGQVLAKSAHPLFLVPIAMIMGYFIVKAEPAVYVLNKQVEEITDGAISSKAMGMGLSLGVAVSLGLAMVRVPFNPLVMPWGHSPSGTSPLAIGFSLHLARDCMPCGFLLAGLGVRLLLLTFFGGLVPEVDPE